MNMQSNVHVEDRVIGMIPGLEIEERQYQQYLASQNYFELVTLPNLSSNPIEQENVRHQKLKDSIQYKSSLERLNPEILKRVLQKLDRGTQFEIYHLIQLRNDLSHLLVAFQGYIKKDDKLQVREGTVYTGETFDGMQPSIISLFSKFLISFD